MNTLETPAPTPLTIPSGRRVLVVDDHRDARESMAEVLRQAGCAVNCCSSAIEALQLLDQLVTQKQAFDCIVTDLRMPGMTGIEFILQIERRQLATPVVMVTAHASVATAVEAMRHGAFDYIEKPFDADRFESLVARAIASRGDAVPALEKGENPVLELPAMIGSGRAMQALRQRIAQVAPTTETVLICGESGTGKELVAQAIHAASRRREKPLVSLNCPVLSAQLMESELFGHEKGAFTGADAPRTGRFELADGGTILLDEVTEIDLNLQAKLLRVLQERAFERVGASRTQRVDVRVLATTNRDLQTTVAAGRFREDLYYRLAVVPLQVPPLRERREDVGELVEYFLARAALRLDREPCTLDAAARAMLTEYHWPGNVRELENLMTRISVLNTTGRVAAEELRRWLIGSPAEPPMPPVAEEMSLEEMERKMIEATLERFGGHRAKTAKALGIGVRTLSGKLRLYGYAPRESSFSRAG